jgi:transcriptional regulator with XRE-family HTH domain
LYKVKLLDFICTRFMNIGPKLKDYREKKGISQQAVADGINALLGTEYKRNTVSNYENGVSEPELEVIAAIVKVLDVSADDLLGIERKPVNAQQYAQPNAQLQVNEPGEKYTNKLGKGKSGANAAPAINQVPAGMVEHVVDLKGNVLIPLTELKAAAGGGYINVEDLTADDFIYLPRKFFKYKNTKHLCVRAKGQSMAPTVQDGSWLPISLLEANQWANMPDKQCFVIVDNEGKTYFKRIKNRIESRGQITLMSDNPDKASYASFDLKIDEIQSIWFVELGLIFRLSNIHDNYFSRLDQMEESIQSIAQDVAKLKLKQLPKGG